MPEDPLDNVALTASGDGSILRLRVTPGSAASSIEGAYGSRLKLRIKAPAEKGKANKELIRFLASSLQLKRDQVTIVAGEGAREKVIRITGCSPQEVKRRLGKAYQPMLNVTR